MVSTINLGSQCFWETQRRLVSLNSFHAALDKYRSHPAYSSVNMYGNIQHFIFCCLSIFSASHTDAHIWLYRGEDWSEMALGKRFKSGSSWLWEGVFESVIETHPCTHKWLQNTAVIRCIIATCRKEPGESRGLSELTSRALYHCSVKKWDDFLLDFERRRDRKREREVWEGKVKARWLQIDSLKRKLQVQYKITSFNSICDLIENNSNYNNCTCNRSLRGKEKNYY